MVYFSKIYNYILYTPLCFACLYTPSPLLHDENAKPALWVLLVNPINPLTLQSPASKVCQHAALYFPPSPPDLMCDQPERKGRLFKVVAEGVEERLDERLYPNAVCSDDDITGDWGIG